jgi:hypothetical protein
MTTLPAMAVTLLGSLPWALLNVTLKAKVVLVVPLAGATRGLASWFGGAAATGPRMPSRNEAPSSAPAPAASAARPPSVA